MQAQKGLDFETTYSYTYGTGDVLSAGLTTYANTLAVGVPAEIVNASAQQGIKTISTSTSTSTTNNVSKYYSNRPVKLRPRPHNYVALPMR